MEKYLRKCLDSLIVSDEKMQRLEVLVINDGSKDSSSQIAHDFESKYPETFRVIDKENGNYGSCINRGLKEATGKYVKVLDADDYFMPKSLEEHLALLFTTDADLVLTDYVLVGKDGSVKKKMSLPLEQNIEYEMEQVCIKEGVIDVQMHAVTYKLRNLIEFNYHQTEGISYTDQEWIFLPMTTIQRVVYQPLILYYYLVEREGQTMQSSVLNKSISQQVICAINRLEDFKKRNLNLSGNMKCYLYHCLNRIVCYVYRATTMRALYSVNELEIFDNKIKSLNNEFYQQLESEAVNLGFFRFRYINFFRKNKKTAPIIIRMSYKIMYKLFHD